MMWSEINRWAKEKGFKISRKDGVIRYNKVDDPDVCGIEDNVEDLAKTIFNIISDYKWVEYQKNYFIK